MFTQNMGELLPPLTEPPIDGAPVDTTPSWITGALDLFKSGVTVYNQQKILDANVARARQGLPPINTASIAPTVNVGVSPEIKNMLIMGAGALALIFLLKRKR